MTVGEKIKEARLQAGLTQAELAEKLGVPYQSVGQWERGVRNPKFHTLYRIASALGVTAFDLIMDDVSVGVELTDGVSVYSNNGKITLTPESLKNLKKQRDDEDERRKEAEDIEALLDEFERVKDGPSELKLLQKYRRLNIAGQQKAIEQLELLLGNPTYCKEGGNNDTQE